jgi:hypothetical protein
MLTLQKTQFCRNYKMMVRESKKNSSNRTNLYLILMFKTPHIFCIRNLSHPGLDEMKHQPYLFKIEILLCV